MRVWSIRYRCTAGTGVAARLLECPGGAGSINMYESDMSCFITDNVMIIQAGGGGGGDSRNTSHVNTKHACKGLFSNYHKSCMIYVANSKVNTVCCFIVAMLIYRAVTCNCHYIVHGLSLTFQVYIKWFCKRAPLRLFPY